MKQLIACLFAAAMSAPALAQDGGSSASASMMNADGQEVGTVSFSETKSGFLVVTVEMSGMSPGIHGFHVHETGECSAEDGFKSAGDHLAAGKEHGVEAQGGPHPGDFPNLHVGEDGMVKVEFLTDRLSLSEGDAALVDGDGSAVIVHSGSDDYSSQPSGDAGDRIACGIVRPQG